MSFVGTRVTRVTLAQALKCWLRKGLPCLMRDAYDGLFDAAIVHRGRAFYMILRRLPALAVAFALVWSVGLSAQNDKKRDDAQKKEIQGVIKVVDDVAAGQTAANDMNVAWVHEDVLKAQGNKQYMPFTVSFDPTKVSGGTVAFYWRVVSKTAAPPPAPDPKSKDKDKDKKKPEYAYEDISFVQVTPNQNPMRVSRSFTVPGGAYDVFVVVKEPTPEKAP